MQIFRAFTKFFTLLGLTFLASSCNKGFLIKEGEHPKTYQGAIPSELQVLQRLQAPPEVRTSLNTYSSCQDLTADINAGLDEQWLATKASISRSIASRIYAERTPQKPAREYFESDASGSEGVKRAIDASTGNNQIQAIDESDRFRVGSQNIFALAFLQSHVIDRQSLDRIGSLDLRFWSSPNLFTQGDKLIVIGSLTQTSSATKVSIFQTFPKSLPLLIREEFISGSYRDSRLFANQLIVLTESSLPTESIAWSREEFAEEPWYQDPLGLKFLEEYRTGPYRLEAFSRKRLTSVAESVNGIPCQSIAEQQVSDWDLRLGAVMSIDISTPEAKRKMFASIGHVDQLFMDEHAVYLLKTQLQWFSQYIPAESQVYIEKIAYQQATGALTPEGAGVVRGRIKDRWSLFAYPDGQHLAIATSTGNIAVQQGDQVAQNHLFILKSQAESKTLSIIGRHENFGTREDIRSVRYTDAKAYIVTFKKTDPLFAFDIADPTQPRPLSGLKIPGFSTYMHPLAEGRMLGLGFDTIEQGDTAFYQVMQISLFDTSDPTQMSRLQKIVYGERGTNSEATTNPHAFYFDSSRSLLGFPLTEISDKQMRVLFSGAPLLSFQGNTVKEVARFSHREWIPEDIQRRMLNSYDLQVRGATLDIARLFTVDNRLLTLSSLGLKAFDFSTWSVPVKSYSFPMSKELLEYLQPPPPIIWRD